MNLVGRVQWTRRAGSLRRSKFLLGGMPSPPPSREKEHPWGPGDGSAQAPHCQPPFQTGGGLLGFESGRLAGSANEYCLLKTLLSWEAL